jgi:hypothetical protein
LPAASRGAAPYAALLARLIGSAPAVTDVPSLAPSPPWTAWGHRWPCTTGIASLPWSPCEIQHSWAAGLRVLLFNAKKEAFDGDSPQLGKLADEITERLSRAALSNAE